jgi:phenylpropionate dioxygenase-like ring-hydroxylating dioxygenase large terminal subunit
MQKNKQLNIIQELDNIEKNQMNASQEAYSKEQEENNLTDWASVLHEQLLSSQDAEQS